jgi:hypothetical protein
MGNVILNRQLVRMGADVYCRQQKRATRASTMAEKAERGSLHVSCAGVELFVRSEMQVKRVDGQTFDTKQNVETNSTSQKANASGPCASTSVCFTLSPLLPKDVLYNRILR